MVNRSKLSVAIATFNEADNIADCLNSIKDIADEIIIVDGSSTDNTVEIAKKFGVKVTVADNPPNFHINKQKSFDLSSGDWILYLDADERVPKKLAEEIIKVINMTNQEMEDYQQGLKNRKLFLRHQRLLEQRDGDIGQDSDSYAAFFFPRANFFLGKFLKYGGVYPDGVIRLFKKGKAYLPGKSVHEQMIVDGKVGWLQNDLIHYDSKTFDRYLKRNSRYIDLMVDELKKQKDKPSFFDYLIIKPIGWFLTTLVMNKGILDGYQGVVFSLFSALRFPRAYWRYINA